MILPTKWVIDVVLLCQHPLIGSRASHATFLKHISDIISLPVFFLLLQKYSCLIFLKSHLVKTKIQTVMNIFYLDCGFVFQMYYLIYSRLCFCIVDTYWYLVAMLLYISGTGFNPLTFVAQAGVDQFKQMAQCKSDILLYC